MPIDWIAIKKDYLTDPKASHRALAKKYKINQTTVSNKCRNEGWAELRKNKQAEIEHKTLEKATMTVSDFQARKLADGLKMIDKGMTVLATQPGRSAREGKEIVEVGYKIASEALGVDKPGVQVNVQNNMFNMVDFIEAIMKRKAEHGE